MRALRWPHASILLAFVLALVWVVSTGFFTLEAWGARGEPKSLAFELWAIATWCGLPLAIVGAAALGVIGLARARR
jgi:hypothetical protein